MGVGDMALAAALQDKLRDRKLTVTEDQLSALKDYIDAAIARAMTPIADNQIYFMAAENRLDRAMRGHE